MLTLLLERSAEGAEARQIGPIAGLRIEGKSLRILPQDEEVLQFDGDQCAQPTRTVRRASDRFADVRPGRKPIARRGAPLRTL